MTASWSRGRSKIYPYYRCNNSECLAEKKNVRKEIIEEQFDNFLRSIKPKQKTIELFEAVAMEMYKTKYRKFKTLKEDKQKEINGIDDKISKIIDIITNNSNPKLVSSYEKKIEELATEKEHLQSNKVINKDFEVEFGTALNRVLEIIKNPINKWYSDDLYDKNIVLKIVFDGKPIYDQKTGFGTAKKSCGIRLFEEITTSKSHDVICTP